MRGLIIVSIIAVIAWTIGMIGFYHLAYDKGVASVVVTPFHYKTFEIVQEDTVMYDLKGVYWYKGMDMSAPIWDSVWISSPTRKTVGYDKFYITDE